MATKIENLDMAAFLLESEKRWLSGDGSLAGILQEIGRELFILNKRMDAMEKRQGSRAVLTSIKPNNVE